MLRIDIGFTCFLAVTALSTPVAAGPAPTRHEVAELTVALMRCDKGDAAPCFDAASEIVRFNLTLRREYTPLELRKRGWALLDKKCKLDDAAACANYGVRLLEANNIEPAIVALERACELKEGGSCLSLGNLYRSEKRDAKRALEYFEQACKAGSARGCVRLAFSLAEATPVDRKRIELLYRKACKGDDSIGCSKSGETRRAQGDRGGAYFDYYRACELGQSESCYIAGTLAEIPERARWLMLRACEARLAEGCSALADLLLVEAATGRQWGKAILIAERACSLGGISPCKQAEQIRSHPPDYHCKVDRDCEKLCSEGIGKSCELFAAYLEDPLPAYELGCKAGNRESCAQRDKLLQGTTIEALAPVDVAARKPNAKAADKTKDMQPETAPAARKTDDSRRADATSRKTGAVVARKTDTRAARKKDSQPTKARKKKSSRATTVETTRDDGKVGPLAVR